MPGAQRVGDQEQHGGASQKGHVGLIRKAHKGTLFLDEIGDMPLRVQARLLRVLQERCVQPLGSSDLHPVDVRLVAATSIDLARVVRAGRFNERLYQYLREGALELPPLRERPGDILPLAEYFVGIYSVRLQRSVPLVSEAAQQVLEAHFWPGNTRELENVIHFALLVSTGDEILPEHLNLPEASGPQLQIERLVTQINIGGSVAERKALKDLLIRLSETL